MYDQTHLVELKQESSMSCLFLSRPLCTLSVVHASCPGHPSIQPTTSIRATQSLAVSTQTASGEP